MVATAGAHNDPFPEKTTRAEREFAMDQELKWNAARVDAPVLEEEYDEEAVKRGHVARLPRDLASDTFVPPEVRFTGAQQMPPSQPPLPWNPKMVVPIWLETRGPHEAPLDDAFEWTRTGRRADAGLRRYSAYASLNNRDGPRMMAGLHPSRSALRPMAPTPVRTIASHVLECRYGIQPRFEIGTSADALECGVHGHLTVHYANGRSRMVRGAFEPERRPFTGLTEIIPASAGQALEGHARWTEITDERSKALGKSQGTVKKERKLATRSSMRSGGLSGMSSDSRPHTRGTELSATFADEMFMNDIVTEFDAESRANSRAQSRNQKTRF